MPYYGTQPTIASSLPGLWVRNPDAPSSLWDGLQLDGPFAGLHPGTTAFRGHSELNRDGTLTNYTDPAAGWGWASELGRQSQILDGSTQHIWFDDNAAFELQTFSIAAWVKLTTTATRDSIASKWDSYNVNYREFIFESNAGTLRSIISDTGSYDANYIASGGTITAGVWTHCGMRFSGNALHDVLVNGTVTGTDATPAASRYAGPAPLLIGAEAYGYPTVANPFIGQLADCLLWNRVVSVAEFEWLKNPANLLYVTDTRTVFFVSGGAPPVGSRRKHPFYGSFAGSLGGSL